MKTNPMLATLATEFLLLPANMHVEEVLIDKYRLILMLSSTQLSAACPSCSSQSARVHSHYTRTLVDLPCQQRAVVSAPFKRDSAREKQFHASNQHVLAQQQVSRAKCLAVFEEVRALSQQGLSMRTIARSLSLSRERVRRSLQMESFPEAAPRRRSLVSSKLDPFVPYVLKRWNEGKFNGTQLYREIREQGYTGSLPLVSLLIADLRRMLPPPAHAEVCHHDQGT